MSKDEEYFTNKQMEMLQVSNEELNKIYDSICKLQQLQKQHAELIREMAGLLGLITKEDLNIIV